MRGDRLEGGPRRPWGGREKIKKGGKLIGKREIVSLLGKEIKINEGHEGGCCVSEGKIERVLCKKDQGKQ